MIGLLISDSRRYGGRNFIRIWFRDPRFRACCLIRFGCFLNTLNLFRDSIFLRLCKNRLALRYGVDTTFEVIIGPGLKIVHLGGLVIHGKAVIGRNLTILNNVTVGQKDSRIDVPVIGDNVFIGVFSAILGKVVIGSNVVIGSHSLVLKDVKDNSTVFGIPAKCLE